MKRYAFTEVETVTEVDPNSDQPPIKLLGVSSTDPQLLKWCLSEFQDL